MQFRHTRSDVALQLDASNCEEEQTEQAVQHSDLLLKPTSSCREYSIPPSQVSQDSQTVSDVLVQLDFTYCPEAQVVQFEHTLSDVSEHPEAWYWLALHTVQFKHILFCLAVHSCA